MKNKIISCIHILWLLIILPFNASLATENYSLEFQLSVSNQQTHFNFSPAIYKTRTEQLGINWYEPFSDIFHAGLELGYIDMSQPDNPTISARFTSGEYAGLLLKFIPVEHDIFSISLNYNYRISRSQGALNNQETHFSWNQNLAFAELKYHPTKQINFHLASEYLLTNGKQRDSGIITQTRNFIENEHEGYRFGVNFTTDKTGIVGLEWSTGFNTGIRLYFLRKL